MHACRRVQVVISSVISLLRLGAGVVESSRSLERQRIRSVRLVIFREFYDPLCADVLNGLDVN